MSLSCALRAQRCCVLGFDGAVQCFSFTTTADEDNQALVHGAYAIVNTFGDLAPPSNNAFVQIVSARTRAL